MNDMATPTRDWAQALRDVRLSHRILAAFYSRVFALFDDVEQTFPELDRFYVQVNGDIRKWTASGPFSARAAYDALPMSVFTVMLGPAGEEKASKITEEALYITAFLDMDSSLSFNDENCLGKDGHPDPTLLEPLDETETTLYLTAYKVPTSAKLSARTFLSVWEDIDDLETFNVLHIDEATAVECVGIKIKLEDLMIAESAGQVAQQLRNLAGDLLGTKLATERE